MAEAEITTMSGKGQVVIPQPLRKQLKLKPKTKFLVYGAGDTIMLRRLAVADIGKEMEALLRRVDRRITKFGELTEREIAAEVQKYKKKR